MKNSVLQFTKQAVNDSKQFIDGNVADYLLTEMWANDNDFYSYLSDEEIESMHNDAQRTKELGEEVESFIKDNFNFDISEFVY